MNRDDLRAALQNRNVQAFLRVIRSGEGTADEDGYRRCFGGELFEGFEDHPRRLITKGRYTSTAAGAYQFLARTWDGLVRQYAFADFSPASQDEAAVALIAGRRALDDVLAGRIPQAIARCAREWASLPGSPYGQPTRTLAQAMSTYAQFGGYEAALSGLMPDVAPPAPAGAPHSPKETATMPPFLLAALPALIEAIPKLGKLFGSGTEVQQRNIAAAETVAQLVQDATGAKNIQEAVEVIKTQPEMAQAARAAVEANWFTLTESGGGGIDGARKYNTTMATSGINALRSPAFILSCVLLIFPLLLSIDVFYVNPDRYQSELRTQIVTGLLMVISMVGAFWLGSSFGSARKDERM